VFGNIMKQIDIKYSELHQFTVKEDILVGLFEKMNSISKYIKTDDKVNNVSDQSGEEKEEDFSVIFKNIECLCQALKRRFVFDSFKQAFPLHKSNWASAPINALFKKAYIEKVRFNESQNAELENMINLMKNSAGINLVLDSKRQIMDEKIKNNPLESYYKVSDARSEITVMDNGGKWEAKQGGLTASKMYMNN